MDTLHLQYNVVIDDSLDDFNEKVLDFIKRGWEPLGGISTTPQDSKEYPIVFVQAMIKKPFDQNDHTFNRRNW